MSERQIALEVQFEVLGCARCGITFGVPAKVVRERRRDHQSFYCPHGHGNHFPGQSAEEKLRKRLEFERSARERWEREASVAKASARAYKGQVTRLKNRTAAGMCPC